MSFILDALRKSDTERQQQAAPGLATTVQRTQGGKPSIWIPLLTAVLILNAAVLTWFLLTDAGETTAEPTAAAATPATPAATADTRSLREEVEPKPDTMAPAAAATPPPAAREPVVAVAQEPAPPIGRDAAAAVIAATPEQPDANTDTIRPGLPGFQQLLAGGIISVSPLHLDIHVFAGEPSKRFVFINMAKYREGDRLTEGPVLEEITDDGVILNHQGNRFTLERN